MASVYEDMVHTVREYLGHGWHPEIRLVGAQHIEEALERGRGAVLWGFSSTVGGLVGRKALRAAGFDVTLLSTDIHPYSGTRFGRQFLNPIRTEVEDRYLAGRVTMRSGAAAAAVGRLTQLVRRNEIVEIAATGTSDSVASLPFLGGSLNLALGGPMIATMGHSPLIPLFPIPVAPDEFEVHVETPLEGSARLSPRENAVHLAEQYAAVLQRYVQRVPFVWRGWFAKTNWLPGSLGPRPQRERA